MVFRPLYEKKQNVMKMMKKIKQVSFDRIKLSRSPPKFISSEIGNPVQKYIKKRINNHNKFKICL